MKRVCVYCGSSPGNNPAYVQAGRNLGAMMVKRGIGLVYGGAAIGVMGAIANEVLALGGEAIGVIPEALAVKEVSHTNLTEQHVVGSMHERKAMMAELSDGFVALPGGWGTIEEIFEILTWAQLGFHAKPCGLLNIEGYYDGLFEFLNHAVHEGFVKPAYSDLLILENQPADLLDRFSSYQAPKVRKWISDEDET